jgi:hypothetical protein
MRECAEYADHDRRHEGAGDPAEIGEQRHESLRDHHGNGAEDDDRQQPSWSTVSVCGGFVYAVVGWWLRGRAQKSTR